MQYYVFAERAMALKLCHSYISVVKIIMILSHRRILSWYRESQGIQNERENHKA